MKKDKNNKDQDFIEIDLGQIFKAMAKKLWLIIVSILICASIAFGYTYKFIKPQYQASTYMYVNNSSLSIGSTSISLSDLTAAQGLVSTYLVILDTRNTLNEVIKEAHLDYTYEELKGMISAEAVKSTEIFSITVTDNDPKEATLIANTIAKVLPSKIATVVDGSSVRVVDKAVVPIEKSSPSYARNTAIGIAIGLLISIIFIIIKELSDDRIHSENELIQYYDYPVLAVIPIMISNENDINKKTTRKGNNRG